MGIFDFFGRARAQANASVQPAGPGASYGLDDPTFLEAIRTAVAGGRQGFMLNGAINRCVRLHAESIGMLPLHLHHKDITKGVASDHPLDRVLHVRPNNWQTPFEFKRLMQATMLRAGAAYAQIVWSRGRVLQFQPLTKFQVEPKQNSDWSITYELTSVNGVRSRLPQSEMFVLRDLDLDDGVRGSPRVEQAKDAINLIASARRTAQKMFDNGMNLGGALKTSQKLSKDARDNLRESMAARTGAGNAGKWLLLEEGLDAQVFAQTMKDSMQVENVAAAIEEIARIFGTPRPLLMMDETSWGSGIDALGLFFIQYCLAPQFVNWEQAVARSAMTDDDRAEFAAKFNDGALLRGSKKDQAEVFSKALGAGGSQGWSTVNEVRALNDQPAIAGGDVIPARAAGKENGATTNDPAKPA